MMTTTTRAPGRRTSDVARLSKATKTLLDNIGQFVRTDFGGKDQLQAVKEAIAAALVAHGVPYRETGTGMDVVAKTCLEIAHGQVEGVRARITPNLSELKRRDAEIIGNFKQLDSGETTKSVLIECCRRCHYGDGTSEPEFVF